MTPWLLIQHTHRILLILFFLWITDPASGQVNSTDEDKAGFLIMWEDTRPAGRIFINNGRLERMRIVSGRGRVDGSSFRIKSAGEVKLEVISTAINTGPGSQSTLVHVLTESHPFSFFLRDVNEQYPIYIPEFRVVVSVPGDPRGYRQIIREIQAKNLRLKLEQIESEPEYSYDEAAFITRDQPCPTWLGLSRDVRNFEIDFARKNEPTEMGIINPKMAASPVFLNKEEDREVQYGFVLGRGVGPVLDVNRRLDQGILPILRTDLVDEDISYESICFTSLES
ncbi:MAG: hypothetical protein KFF73_15980, partial [Cyclobacteriaceae bacterium]|nr:hypothetical protein [Cyclobacteriaceae bacterium]